MAPKRRKGKPETTTTPTTRRSTRDRQPPKRMQEQHASVEDNTAGSDVIRALEQKQDELQDQLTEQSQQQQQILAQQQNIIELLQAKSSTENKHSKHTKDKKRSHKHVSPATSDDGSSEDSSSESEGEVPITYTKHKPVVMGGLSVGHSIPHAMKKKIWKHKYIEFSELFNPHSHQSYTLTLGKDTTKPTLNFTSHHKKFLSESQWGMAWNTYMSIYLKKYPHELDQMITYHQNIQKLMQRGANWRSYDFQFRVDREFDQCKWDVVRMDLERDAYQTHNGMNSTNLTTKNKQSFRAPRNTVPKGYCYAYNTQNQHCKNTNCSYKHNCLTCQGKHTSFRHVHGLTAPQIRQPSSRQAAYTPQAKHTPHTSQHKITKPLS